MYMYSTCVLLFQGIVTLGCVIALFSHGKERKNVLYIIHNDISV